MAEVADGAEKNTNGNTERGGKSPDAEKSASREKLDNLRSTTDASANRVLSGFKSLVDTAPNGMLDPEDSELRDLQNELNTVGDEANNQLDPTEVHHVLAGTPQNSIKDTSTGAVDTSLPPILNATERRRRLARESSNAGTTRSDEIAKTTSDKTEKGYYEDASDSDLRAMGRKGDTNALDVLDRRQAAKEHKAKYEDASDSDLRAMGRKGDTNALDVLDRRQEAKLTRTRRMVGRIRMEAPPTLHIKTGEQTSLDGTEVSHDTQTDNTSAAEVNTSGPSILNATERRRKLARESRGSTSSGEEQTHAGRTTENDNGQFGQVPEDEIDRINWYKQTLEPLTALNVQQFGESFTDEAKRKYAQYLDKNIQGAISAKVNPNARYPGTVGAVIGNAGFGMAQHIIASAEGRIPTPDEVLSMPFKDFAKMYLEYDVPTNFDQHYS